MYQSFIRTMNALSSSRALQTRCLRTGNLTNSTNPDCLFNTTLCWEPSDMQLGSQVRGHCRQPGSIVRPRQSRPLRGLRCYAKRKGEQKNEGMYFTYEKVTKPDANAGKKSPEQQQQQFGWVSSARSSVQQYRQAPYKRPNKQQQQQPQQQPKQQQQQQQQGQSQSAAADAATVLQPKPVHSTEGPAAAEAAAAAPSPNGTEVQQPKVVAAPVQQPGQQQQQHQEVEASTPTSNSTDVQAVNAQPQQPVSSSSSQSRSNKEDALARRKQQLLQRMKGSAGNTAAAPPAAAAAAPVAASLAAAETAAAGDGMLPGLDTDGEFLLQELLNMAQELTDPNSTAAAAAVDNDPMADPLADILPEHASSSSSSSSNGNGEISVADLGVAAAGGDQEAADMLAAITAMQQRMQSAAAAADVDSSSMLRVADLLSWEAEEAAKTNKLTDMDVDAELEATRKGDYGEIPSEGQEGEWEYVDDDEDVNEGEVDNSWYEDDPELQRMLAADGADFAKMLAQFNEMPDSSAEPGSSSSGSAAAAEQQDAWAGLGVEDWLEAVAADSDSSSGTDEAAVADEDALLPDVISAIESDKSLDDKAKMEARLRIQGMFNDPTAAAEGPKRSSRGSKQQQHRDEGPVVKGPTTTGAAAAAGQDDEEMPVLLPRPVRPSQ